MEGDIANATWADADGNGEEADHRPERGERLRRQSDQARLCGPDPRQAKTDQQHDADNALGDGSLVVRVEGDQQTGVNGPGSDKGYGLDEQNDANHLLR